MIKQMVRDYSTEMMGSFQEELPLFKPSMLFTGPRVKLHHHQTLCRAITRKEVKKALWE